MKKLSLSKVAFIVFVFWAVSGVGAFGQTFTTLASFDGTNGTSPVFGSLVQGVNGNFYGTTNGGGAYNDGTIFEVTPSGTVTTVYSFCAKVNCRDGSSPLAGLTQTANGNFYGTTDFGGTSTNPTCDEHNYRCGTVFEINPEGKLITLYSFCAQTNCADGSRPYDTLVQGYDGDFYGTTYTGGANAVCTGCGTVFKITPTGTLTTLHSFCSLANCADGGVPSTGLVLATDGKLYGTTPATIFSITPAGELTTLYSFCSLPNCADGEAPQGPLIQAADGNFYGTTEAGGAFNYGTVFKITPSGKLTTLYNFCSQPNCTDGGFPVAGLIQATDGNFYGTTVGGGTSTSTNCGVDAPGCGTIFQITPQGLLTTLYSFCTQPNCSDGDLAEAGLVQSTDGNFYGTTDGGGSNPCPPGCGTVYRLSMGLGPFVETVPVARGVGEPVTILGNNLTGTTSVSFNGTAAAFTVVSSSAIKTTVPAGATTGTVEVVTPSGTLSSNVPFRVEP